MPGSGGKTEIITIERYTRTSDGGDETSRQGALRPRSKYRFNVLSAGVEALGLTTEDRIVWNGDIYNIRERPRRLPRKPETEIIAETGVTS